MRAESRNRAAAAALLCLLAAGGAARGAPELPKGKGGEVSGAGSAPGGSTSTSTGAVTSKSTIDNEEIGGLLESKKGKFWDVGATWETHGLLWQTNTGAGRNKLFNFAYLYGGVYLTKDDRIRVRGGFYQYLLADDTETGVRATDLSLSYSHLFHLPWELGLRATVAVTAPISFYSQKASLYTSPTATLELSREYKGFSVDFHVFGGGYITKYSSAEGGAPNPRGVLGTILAAEYSFWFHKALVLGADIYTAWLWYYDVGSPPPGSAYQGAVMDTQFQAQPIQQAYGGEVYVRYSLPTIYGLHSSLMLAVADGDPTLGYNSVNIDGISHVFLNYYSTFEVYGAVSLRY